MPLFTEEKSGALSVANHFFNFLTAVFSVMIRLDSPLEGVREKLRLICSDRRFPVDAFSNSQVVVTDLKRLQTHLVWYATSHIIVEGVVFRLSFGHNPRCAEWRPMLVDVGRR
jgi:hypothetical protein